MENEMNNPSYPDGNDPNTERVSAANRTESPNDKAETLRRKQIEAWRYRYMMDYDKYSRMAIAVATDLTDYRDGTIYFETRASTSNPRTDRALAEMNAIHLRSRIPELQDAIRYRAVIHHSLRTGYTIEGPRQFILSHDRKRFAKLLMTLSPPTDLVPDHRIFAITILTGTIPFKVPATPEYYWG